MDAARRWQAVSLVTAVASLTGGALMIGHQTTQTLPPIDLEISTLGQQTFDEDRRVGRDPAPTAVEDEIVTPPIIESHREPVTDPDTAPPEPTSPREPSTPAPTDPASSASPDSVDSPDSLDSD